MRIGFIDADISWREQPKNPDLHIFRKPNMQLAQLMGFHKREGDVLEWYETMGGHYDKVYVSKSLISTPDYTGEISNADEVICLCAGWRRSRKDRKLKAYHPKAQFIIDELEDAMLPDYTLYPESIRPNS